MKKALLVVGHGSKSSDAVAVFDRMIGLIREKSEFQFVAGAHMELAEPGIDAAVAELAAMNVSSICIAPYFLYEGMHYKRDIPGIIEKLASRYSGITFKLAKPIGYEPLLADVVLSRVKDVS